MDINYPGRIGGQQLRLLQMHTVPDEEHTPKSPNTASLDIRIIHHDQASACARTSCQAYGPSCDSNQEENQIFQIHQGPVSCMECVERDRKGHRIKVGTANQFKEPILFYSRISFSDKGTEMVIFLYDPKSSVFENVASPLDVAKRKRWGVQPLQELKYIRYVLHSRDSWGLYWSNTPRRISKFPLIMDSAKLFMAVRSNYKSVYTFTMGIANNSTS